MKSRIFVAILLVSSLLLPISTVQAADWLQYQTGPADTYNRSDLPAEYDITRTDFGISSTEPDEYWFF